MHFYSANESDERGERRDERGETREERRETTLQTLT